MKHISKWTIFSWGEDLENWLCDAGPDGELMSNGSVEHLVYFEGSYYWVYTDVLGEEVYRAHRISAAEVQELMDEGGFPGELIQRHRAARA
jgi:hypothetical protein